MAVSSPSPTTKREPSIKADSKVRTWALREADQQNRITDEDRVFASSAVTSDGAASPNRRPAPVGAAIAAPDDTREDPTRDESPDTH